MGRPSAVKRNPRASTNGYDMLRGLQRVWLMSEQPCGKYLPPHQALIYPDAKTSTRSVANKHREAIPILTHVPEIDRQPNLVAIDTVARCGHTLRVNTPTR